MKELRLGFNTMPTSSHYCFLTWSHLIINMDCALFKHANRKQNNKYIENNEHMHKIDNR